jgi:endonuclease-3
MTRESHLALVRRARRIFRILDDTYPDARCELDFSTPFQLLVATVLSAQTTDVAVNKVTPAIFSRYRDASALAGARLNDLEEILHPLGFFRAKASTLVRLGAMLDADFGGRVPGTMEELLKLPGVGRKTANVVLGNAFGVPGLTVDTHFGRLARRFRFTSAEDPDVVEEEVGQLFPRKDWVKLSHLLVIHGRRVCVARKPACWNCPATKLCPSYGEGPIVKP